MIVTTQLCDQFYFYNVPMYLYFICLQILFCFRLENWKAFGNNPKLNDLFTTNICSNMCWKHFKNEDFKNFNADGNLTLKQTQKPIKCQ